MAPTRPLASALTSTMRTRTFAAPSRLRPKLDGLSGKRSISQLGQGGRRGGRLVLRERDERERLRLAAQRQRRYGARLDRTGKAREPVHQRGRGERRTIEGAAGLEHSRGGVHRVPDQRDLLLARAELADHHLAGVQRRPELRREAELAPVAPRAVRDPATG